MKYLKAVLLSLVLMFGFGMAFAPAHAAAAYDPLNATCNNAGDGEAQSPTCGSRTNTNPLTGTDGLLMKITRIIAIISGVTAIIVIIVGGARYMTADGDSQKAAGARNAVIGALVGLFIISLSTLIINFVLTKIG